MKIDSSSMISSTLSDQITNKKDEEKLKSFSDALDKAKDEGDDDKLKEVSQQFEAFFINQIFKSMRNSAQWGEGLIEKSHARSTYESMHDERLADEISTGRGIGISDLIYKQMSKRYDIGSEAVKVDDDKKDSETGQDEEKTTSLDIKA
tara:strand:+ start:374 stop:820 length:447 start_codon:yes stop_codon:yes gene_type:complete